MNRALHDRSLILRVEQADGDLMLHVTGEIDVAMSSRANAPSLLELDGNVVVDLANVEFLDSIGLAVLIGAR